MGNYQFSSQNKPKQGQVMTVVHNKYTKELSTSSDSKEQAQLTKDFQNYFGIGSQVQVIGTKNLMSSRPNAPPVTVTYVKMKDGSKNLFFTSNLN